MPHPGAHETKHEITIHAPADHVYSLIADVAHWPFIFQPTVHVDHVERGGHTERIQIWATANGEVKSWISRRHLDEEKLRIDFRQEVSAPPVAAMGGSWLIDQTPENESRVRLLHDYRAVDDDPDKLAWIDRAVDHNSRSELAALKNAAERTAGNADLVMTFEDSVRITGAAEDIYDFINEAQHWPSRLPHVASVSLREETAGVQLLEMETHTKDGSVHSSTSVRICFPHSKIIYKQIQVPPLMTTHTGQWLLTEDADGTTATSQHTVMISESNIAPILGDKAVTADARRYVRAALGGNSLATLEQARKYAERRR